MFQIDFVIPWVDGQDKEHIKRRKQHEKFQKKILLKDKEQSTDDRRFFQYDELRFTLRSIAKFAPWYNKIFLVTDKQIPSFLDASKLSRDRIYLVDHEEIFQDSMHALPTFNTRAISSKIHNIRGLSEFFIYGNDDFFFGSHISKSFFFDGEYPIVYGEWLKKKTELTLYQQGLSNAAKLMGYPEHEFINLSHGFQPMRRSFIRHMEQLFPNSFENNVSHKFRDRSQFLIESLMNHYCTKNFDLIVQPATEMVHFSFEMCRKAEIKKIEFLFSLFRKGERKMMCINEYQSLYQRYPQIKNLLNGLCGSPLASEIG